MKKKNTWKYNYLHLFSTNNDDMFDSWDMEHNRQNFSNFEPFFALLPTKKLKNLDFGKNENKPLEILSFYTCVP